MTALAASLTVAAVLLARPSGRWWVRHRLGGSRTVALPWPAILVLVGLTAGGPLLVALSGPHVVLGLTVGCVAMFAFRHVRAARQRALLHVRSAQVAEMVGLMSAELRAGILPARVLAGLEADFSFLAPAAHAAQMGGDVPAALRSSADVPGQLLLRELAGAWHVADRAGAPLARVLDRLEEASRGDRELEREVEAGLAPARATGRLMAVLPVFGLLLGSGMGGDPLAVLTGTWIGVACLAAGSALACAGVAWVERIAASAEQDP